MNPYIIDMAEHNQLKRLEVELYYTAEMDEVWSYVGKKSNQRWTWYAMDKNTGVILAWHNGKRSDEDFQQLVKYLESIPETYIIRMLGERTRGICLKQGILPVKHIHGRLRGRISISGQILKDLTEKQYVFRW